MGLGQCFLGLKMQVNYVAIFGNLFSERFFFVESQHFGKRTGGSCLDQIGDLVPHPNERFAEPPDDALGAAIEVDGDFGVVN